MRTTMQDMSELSGLADGELDLAADRARWTALVVLCAGMLMIVLDVTIVNVALPVHPAATSASPRPGWPGWSTPT